MESPDYQGLINHRRFQKRDKFGATKHTNSPTRRIVLTGGPGSGKSTAAAFLAREFVDDLWVLPESATLLYKGGLPRPHSALGVQVAQRAIFTVQRSLEEATALQHPDRVQLCDRATIDGAAYWPDGADDFFRAMNTSRERELARYDAVVYMHTAALLPAGYERDMDVRTEDAKEAIELDERIFALYANHPNVIRVESHASFLDKLTVVRNAIAELVKTPMVEPGAPLEPVLIGIGGGASETEVDEAPVSSLMGLANMHHILPVD